MKAIRAIRASMPRRRTAPWESAQIGTDSRDFEKVNWSAPRLAARLRRARSLRARLRRAAKRTPRTTVQYPFRHQSEEAGMKILVVGKGGREHALVWKLAQSPRTERVWCAPGNAGTALDGVNVPIEATEIDKLVRFAKKEEVGLTVVGPEEPLALGIVDQFQAAGLRIFGPSRQAAQIEASKVFAKQLMRHADVPTAEFRVFDHPDPARHYVETREYPVVIKADGLAAGKGVIVCATKEEALEAIQRIMVREEFGRAAGRQIVIEKR